MLSVVQKKYCKKYNHCLHHAPGEGNTSNPLKQVLNAVGEQVDCAVYDRVSILMSVCIAHPVTAFAFSPSLYHTVHPPKASIYSHTNNT